MTDPGHWRTVPDHPGPAGLGGAARARAPYLGELRDLLAHLQVQVLRVLHGEAGLERPGGGRGEFALTGGAVERLPAGAGRHLPGEDE